jgi:hypothetical protein
MADSAIFTDIPTFLPIFYQKYHNQFTGVQKDFKKKLHSKNY